jgi:hypothetical protein
MEQGSTRIAEYLPIMPIPFFKGKTMLLRLHPLLISTDPFSC